MQTGQAVLAAAVIIPLALALLGVISRARRQGQPGAKGGIVSGWLAHRRALRLENTRHYNGMLRDAARHRFRLREHEARERARQQRGTRTAGSTAEDADTPGNGPSPDEAPRPRWKATVTHVWSRWHPAGDETHAGAPEPPAVGPALPGAGKSPPGGPAGPGDPAGFVHIVGPLRDFLAWSRISAPRALCGALLTEPPRPDAPLCPRCAKASPAAAARSLDKNPGLQDAATPPRPAQPQEPPARGAESTVSPGSRPAPGTAEPIEGVVVTIQPDSTAVTVPGVEMIIEGAAALRRHAMAGNAQAKRRAILGIGAGIDVLAATVRALSMDMAEPGQNYGPEITDPMSGAASHCNAASTVLSEIDGRLLAIIRAAEELAASGVRAPHHDQMAVQ